MIRFIFFSSIFILGVVGPFVVFIVGACVYALRYTAYELIVLAGMIDAYYGIQYPAFPKYTLIAIGGIFLLEWLKRQLSVYNE